MPRSLQVGPRPPSPPPRGRAAAAPLLHHGLEAADDGLRVLGLAHADAHVAAELLLGVVAHLVQHQDGGGREGCRAR